MGSVFERPQAVRLKGQGQYVRKAIGSTFDHGSKSHAQHVRKPLDNTIERPWAACSKGHGQYRSGHTYTNTNTHTSHVEVTYIYTHAHKHTICVHAMAHEHTHASTLTGPTHTHIRMHTRCQNHIVQVSHPHTHQMPWPRTS